MTNCLYWLDLELLTLDVRNNHENQVCHKNLIEFFLGISNFGPKYEWKATEHTKNQHQVLHELL
jgi:hypothetical protein